MNTGQIIYKDSAQSIEKRVEDLLARMTLEEKIAQLGSCWGYEILEDFSFSEIKAQIILKQGIGQITRLGGATNLQPNDAAGMANTIQKYLIEQTRLGIPAMIHEECCSGLMTRGATLFPQAIGVASSWNPVLTEKMAEVIGTQMKAIGAHQGLSPVLDIARDPRWGRTEETMGEDPYLVANLGCAYVRGLQGGNDATGPIATGKHFVGYGRSEGGMNWAPVYIPVRQLREVFLYPFEAAVKEAGLGSIMNSYTEIDGLPCCASKKLFQEILRDTWGFEGIVVSDYFAITMLYEYHRTAKTKAAAAAQAVRTGIDIELPSTDCYKNPLKEALESDEVSLEELDILVKRILTMKFRLGIFEHPYIESEKASLVFETDTQRKLSYELAAESIVLLKNEKILPLCQKTKSIAVIGPNANTWRNMIGDYAYPCHVESTAEMNDTFDTPTPASFGDVSDAVNIVTILEAMKQRVDPQCSVRYAQGCEMNGTSKEGFAEAVEAAKNAEVAIMVLGGRSGLTDGCTSGETRDRASIDLPGVQEDLIHAVLETGTPVVVVLVHGRPYSLGGVNEQIRALVSTWLPGEEGGNAVADVLFGQVNPGGKLPMSFPLSVGQIPVYYSHTPSGGRSHWNGDYVDLSAAPLYPFGHGLSYTEFTYKNLTIDQAEINQDGRVQIELDLQNSGDCEGDEVVQLYVHYIPDNTVITRPVKELKGFKRVRLQPGKQKHLTFTLYAPQLAFYHEDMQLALNPGQVDVMIGSSSSDIRLTGTFTICGQSPLVIQKKVFFSEVTES